MGECVAKVADFSYLTSDNPRYEDPTQIIADIEKGFAKISSAYVAMPDRERAVSRAISELCDGDVLLVAGKGGEDYQERMGIKYAYNDEDFIKKIIKRK
jgi:UDP-N-acetylmuramoyl-L-alanyl-D-glutamate--2,6-diaminopimelate ligase